MKEFKFALLLLLFTGISTTPGWAAGIDFFHGSWEEALELAAAEDKVIFVDAYTTWCGPCKRMAATVFTAEEVGDFFNQNFVCMKIDMEKEEGIRFQQKYPVSAFPTLYFIDSQGKTVHKSKGAKPADQFIKLGKMVLGKVDKSADFAVEYEKGNRDPQLILKYVKALNKAGKPSGKIANDYINSQDDLGTDFNLRFLLAATVEADSRIFDKLVPYKSQVIALESEEVWREVIENACLKTVHKAVEFNSADLLAEAKTKMKAQLPAAAPAFALRADMAFYKGQGDAKKYLKACNSYIKKVVGSNASQLHRVATEIQGAFGKDVKAMALAEKYAGQAAENGGLAKYYVTYAAILYQNKKTSEALAMAKKSLDLAKGNPGEESKAIQLIRKIEREG